jgi:hypothetical protein
MQIEPPQDALDERHSLQGFYLTCLARPISCGGGTNTIPERVR